MSDQTSPEFGDQIPAGMGEYPPTGARPQYNEHADDMISVAVGQAEKRRETSEPVKKQPEPLHTTVRRRTDNLRQALAKAKNRDSVTLPELSRLNGSPITLRVRRLTVQELAASSSLPARADRMVSELINRSMDATAQERARQGMDAGAYQTDVEELVHDLYGGWTREAIAAFFEFQCAVCCAAVVDDDYRLYMTQDEVDADPERGLLVWDIPDPDLEAIYHWVMAQEDAAEQSVMPFRGAGPSGGAVQPNPVGGTVAERADGV